MCTCCSVIAIDFAVLHMLIWQLWNLLIAAVVLLRQVTRSAYCLSCLLCMDTALYDMYWLCLQYMYMYVYENTVYICCAWILQCIGI